jgi:hypothetical protein
MMAIGITTLSAGIFDCKQYFHLQVEAFARVMMMQVLTYDDTARTTHLTVLSGLIS